jgi:DNA-binding PadR family transcriptional regulator
LLILASLKAGERYGHGIALNVAEFSGGRFKLAAGTLYDTLTRSADAGLIAQTREHVVGGRRGRTTG